MGIFHLFISFFGNLFIFFCKKAVMLTFGRKIAHHKRKSLLLPLMLMRTVDIFIFLWLFLVFGFYSDEIYLQWTSFIFPITLAFFLFLFPERNRSVVLNLTSLFFLRIFWSSKIFFRSGKSCFFFFFYGWLFFLFFGRVPFDCLEHPTHLTL